jgi:hypothetical protein
MRVHAGALASPAVGIECSALATSLGATQAVHEASVRSDVLAAFPKSSLDGAEVNSPRTSVSPVRPSFTNESREREDDEKSEPVEDQRRSFAATGTESFDPSEVASVDPTDVRNSHSADRRSMRDPRETRGQRPDVQPPTSRRLTAPDADRRAEPDWQRVSGNALDSPISRVHLPTRVLKPIFCSAGARRRTWRRPGSGSTRPTTRRRRSATSGAPRGSVTRSIRPRHVSRIKSI